MYGINHNLNKSLNQQLYLWLVRNRYQLRPLNPQPLGNELIESFEQQTAAPSCLVAVAAIILYYYVIL